MSTCWGVGVLWQVGCGNGIVIGINYDFYGFRLSILLFGCNVHFSGWH